MTPKTSEEVAFCKHLIPTAHQQCNRYVDYTTAIMKTRPFREKIWKPLSTWLFYIIRWQIFLQPPGWSMINFLKLEVDTKNVLNTMCEKADKEVFLEVLYIFLFIVTYFSDSMSGILSQKALQLFYRYWSHRPLITVNGSNHG